jgi:hypothetical protein
VIVTATLVQSAKQYGLDNLRGQFPIRASKVVDLLVNATSPAAQRGARELLSRMSVGPWKAIRDIHQSADDPTPHLTVEIRDTNYHLRLDARACIFDITGKTKSGEIIRLAGVPPHLRPGAAE